MNDKKRFLLAFVALFALIAGLAALHVLKFQERSELQKKIDSYEKQASDAREKIKRIPTLRQDREKLISFIDQYMTILPKEEHVQHDAFVNTIDQYRLATEIRIDNAEYVVIKEKTTRRGRDAKVAESDEDKGFLRHRYKFKLRGTVPELVQFMNKIENHIRFLKIDALSIKPLGAVRDSDSTPSPDQEEEELALASNPIKEIELTLSTYTYYKAQRDS